MAAKSIERERSPVAILLDPARDIPSGERDIRVEDFLNDKIQTTSDLGDLESLIASVERQKEQLEEQLQHAQSELRQAKTASMNRTSLMLEQTQEFERQQSNVQKRLMIVTSSDTPEEATRKLNGPMEMLRKVELARAYLEMLNDVEELRMEARRHLPADPKEALKPYTELKELAMSLKELQEPAEGAAVHLVNFVESTSNTLWTDMKKIMTDEFDSVLHKMKWPDQTVEPSREFSGSFEKLLDLQAPEIISAREPLILLPISVLARSFIQQFRYHFFSDKPTNHSHHLLTHISEWFIGTVSKWEDYLRQNVGPLLAAHFRGSYLAGNSLYVDPVAAFITAILPILKEKVDNLVEAVSNEPQYFTQMIDQLMKFDDAIRVRFNYDAGNIEFGWKGLTWDVLDTWFPRWLEVEKKFTIDRYRDIMKSPDSGDIDYDSSAPGKTKATYGATRITELIINVTLSYNRVRRFSHKIKFLIGIQAEILDEYWARLKEHLDTFVTYTSTVGRAVHGATKEQLQSVEGVRRLETLCKVFGSADHLISMLKDWGNEEFFVELWEHLQNRARDTPVEDNLAGEMSYNEVRDATSDAVGSEEEGSLFDKTIESYLALRNKAEELIISSLRRSFPTNFKQYMSKPQWTTIGDLPQSSPSFIAVTAELDQPLQALKQDMMFLRRALADAAFRRLWRGPLDTLEDMLFRDVLLKQDFTTLGASRLMQDVAAIQGVIDDWYNSKTRLGVPKLTEAATLLNLPLEAEDGQMNLKEAWQKILGNSGQQAADALATLGMNHLTVGEARLVLAKRVEIQQ
ncbi:related to Rad50-interacting protein 1 [Phialocephala subalpina]|uniref:Related to Rad50-interacting protein 1 n=1 Tax=Phialocephala subalpina TaxID=576137 RepID=A0A1L7XGX0_9HELO|nr:related to Rad50-interacting protein 1 [Phialocephala subalpina]